MQPLLPQRPVVLGAQVATALRRLIITKQLAPGSLLVESKLAEEFDVSRGPIRDAIRELIDEGLVVSAGRSAAVVGLHAQDIDELFSLRAALERLALDTAVAERRNELARLQSEALDDMRAAVEASDPAAFTRADMRFHSAFGEASDHRRLADVWSKYQSTIEDLLLVANLDHDDLAPSLEAHEMLAKLIADGDDEAAHEELTSHLDNSRLRLRAEYLDA
jgi:GntR family transcriptional regulator, gluconate operon transcriptional repressor